VALALLSTKQLWLSSSTDEKRVSSRKKKQAENNEDVAFSYIGKKWNSAQKGGIITVRVELSSAGRGIYKKGARIFSPKYSGFLTFFSS
jgi:hypothetical protein